MASTRRTPQTIWVVTPCYHDVASFTRLRVETQTVIAGVAELTAYQLRFIVIDDTAGDDPEISELAAFSDVEVITPPFNLGHQRGIVYALRTRSGAFDPEDLILTLDSDGEDRPIDIPRLLEPLLDDRTSAGTVVLASRSSRKESLSFKASYLVFRMLFRILTGTVIKSGNFAAYRGTVALRLVRHPHFDLCYSSSFISLDAPVTFVPCPRGSRYAGRSRMNRSRLILHGLRMLMPFTDRIALRSLGSLAIFATLTAAFLTSIVAVWAFTDKHIAGWILALCLSMLVGAFVGIGCCLILFTLFAHSRGTSLSDLESLDVPSARSTPARAN